MLKFFNKGFFIQYATVFILGLILWFPAFLLTPETKTLSHFWGPAAIALNQLIVLMGVWGAGTAYFIIFITGLLVNRMADYHNLTEKAGTLPLFLFVIISSFSPALTLLSPLTIILSLFVLLFIMLFRHDLKKENVMFSFDTGFIAGLLTLFYIPLALMIFLIWFAFISTKGISWRNYLVSFIGLMFPSFLMYTVFFFSGQETAFINQFVNTGFLGMNSSFLPIALNTVLFLFITLIIIISAIKVMNQQTNLSIKQRNYFFILGFYILLTLFINIFFSNQLITYLLLTPAGAITLNNLLSGISKSKLINITLILMLLLFIINTWYSFYNVAQ